jgi:hypothetical protein
MKLIGAPRSYAEPEERMAGLLPSRFRDAPHPDFCLFLHLRETPHRRENTMALRRGAAMKLVTEYLQQALDFARLAPSYAL